MPYGRHEELVASLNDGETFAAYSAVGAVFQVGFVPKVIGKSLVFLGNTFYGKEPSYGKFKAVEVIARIPYQSWELVSYMLLTMFYSDEKKAIELSKTARFGSAAQDNETMHVVVFSQLAKKYGQNSFFFHTLVPLGFSFFYFTSSFLLYLFSPRRAFELNYMFESHAFQQYSRFLELYGDELRHKPVMIDFLDFYGRHAKSEYELFQSIRNDEIIHRNRSMERAIECTRKASS
ncbi:MAG: hypothetical protein A2808_04005 [Candidatus Moranbacteria bacterium RIFCSPHIGHO2_01_FULL_55_24]|nr:MAG: hypothetical protein A2808_04005 [Candidatus Moranbacteria bacterium RIFCSPHIGHO2_01_FULL_55_24]